ncbi:pbuX: xanthine permease [Rubrobacter radiotolerans]|uniref:2-oxo-4-hydroxy-4-carboxy-5-ureidoimidazoline decarboxylase n=1 Tax=Rubrobacter radiotolerans TaxID=42256 RepID=A0A023X336_RUBRA|nr:2-oxo-4-hydroxy-4-carboxy-5-ureidoimidazoline decarboxylase [Rubrobacter radiotolerans]AHY46586.1 pbuX: xanthine permease [Rubrobacter radiotolerans]MDX5893993.1 2-oxo-4-hydroxy-4-carboxy-5-ureidoimidazoline decarboxylase [Rubrobacter radiotolerans]SMC04930.1 nucleobase:cation symporter-2, NCS2 family [Rubrobacter radiotolerans DSM 5868]
MSENGGVRRGAGRTHPVDEVLPAGRMAAFGLQHVMTMYAGIIAVPLIVATALELPAEQLVYIINASFLMCGVATLIQTIGVWKFGVRLPIVQGTTFAAVTPMILIGSEYGLTGIYGSVIVAGILTVIAAPFFGKLLRFFPPVVTGSIITIIGVSLMPVAIRWSAGGVPDAPDFGSPENIGLAFMTLVIILVITRFLGGLFGGFLSRVAILMGLVFGTIIAALLGAADFSGVGDAGWVGVSLPFAFGAPTFHIIPILSMTLVMLIVMVETTADILAIGEITEKRVASNDVARGLRADGLATALGAVFNSFPLTAFAQNVGLVRFTGIKSRFVVAAAGGILLLLGLFPKLAAVVASIPLPVLGGAGLVLFGTVAAAGIQTLSKVDLTDNRNLIIVAVAVALGVIPAALPEFYDGFPEAVRIVFESGITAAAVAAILLNIVFNVLGGRGQDVGDYGENVAGVEEKLTVIDANRLDREAFAERFAPLFQGARWVPEEAYDEGHPFSNIQDMRHSFQMAVYDAPEERQVELLRSYTPLSRAATAEGGLSTLSVRERRAVGLTTLSPEEDEEFQRMNAAYREKFGFPLVTAVRDHTKDTLLDDAESRLRHSREQEILISIVEVVKIANYRLQDTVEESLVGARS